MGDEDNTVTAPPAPPASQAALASSLRENWGGLTTFTFYSFKGGVGRSMGLANTAEVLRRRGLNVLLVDFDLEAPGLERYFDVPEAQHRPAEVLGKRGVIDMVLSYKELRALPAPNVGPTIIDGQGQGDGEFPWTVEPIKNFIVPIFPQKNNRGALSLIPAGRRASGEFTRYAQRVRTFNWEDFYINWDGERFFEWFRKAAGEVADVLMIDSRTGVTEVSGVCTHQLADVVVMFVAPNQQNLEGTVVFARSLANPELVAKGRKGRPLSIISVPSRVEQGEAKLQDSFASQFDTMLGEFYPKNLRFETSAFVDLKIPYVPYYAYMEKVAARDPTPSAADMIKAFERLATALAQTGVASSSQVLGVGSAIAPTAAHQPLSSGWTVNIWLDGVNKNGTLRAGTAYELKFNVGFPNPDAQATLSGLDIMIGELPHNQEMTLLVVLEPGDFILYGVDSLELVLRHDGTSRNTTAFSIEAKQVGIGSLSAIFYLNGRLFKKLSLQLQAVNTPASSASVAAARLREDSQEIVNLIINKLDDGYQFTLKHSGVLHARINLREAQLDELCKRARSVLKDIIHVQDANGNFLYQDEDTTISPEVHNASLQSIARIGYYLYQQLFFAPGNGPDAHRMGMLLREISRTKQLHIQINAARFFFPWALLYDRDTLNLNDIDPQGFWGFKHVIEFLPLFSQINAKPSAHILVAKYLHIGFISNQTIDTQFGMPLIQGQRDYLAALNNIKLVEYPNRQDLLDLLNDADTPTQLIYMYAHAASKLPGEAAGVSDSRLGLSDGKISLEELFILAPINDMPFKQAPLVFMNCTETAELSPYVYDGFIPYFLAKGARGVIGTETEVAALFAIEFAKEFVRRFSEGGQTVGELLRDLRVEYLEQKNNIQALCYVYYGADVMMRWGSQ
jgi:hypothetical protein